VQSLLAPRQAHPALRTGKQWHIGWDDSYFAFLRELPEEKLLIVYNHAGSACDLRIPLDDTPLETAQELHSLFGEVAARIQQREVQVKLGRASTVIFEVR
jgi:hypothetical protein